MPSPSSAIALPRTIAALLAVAGIIAAPIRAQAQVRREAQGAWGGKTNGAGHYADVNATKLYYEIHGTGRPLILLHGGLGAIEMFGPNLPALAKGRQVIAVDLQGHGSTLSATGRSSFRSWARKTVAIPPRPSSRSM